MTRPNVSHVEILAPPVLRVFVPERAIDLLPGDRLLLRNENGQLAIDVEAPSVAGTSLGPAFSRARVGLVEVTRLRWVRIEVAAVAPSSVPTSARRRTSRRRGRAILPR